MKASLFITGISRLRGVVMYELQSTLSTYAKRKYSSGEISLEHLKNILKVSFRLIFQTCQLIRFALTGSPQILERVHSDL